MGHQKVKKNPSLESKSTKNLNVSGGSQASYIHLHFPGNGVSSSPVSLHKSDVRSRMELVVWLVPSLIGDAVAVSIVGVLVRPPPPFPRHNV